MIAEGFLVCRCHETGMRRLWRARHTRRSFVIHFDSFVRVSRRSSYKHCFSEFWGIGFLKTWTKDCIQSYSWSLLEFHIWYIYRVFPYIFYIASFLQVEQKVRDREKRDADAAIASAQKTQARSFPSSYQIWIINPSVFELRNTNTTRFTQGRNHMVTLTISENSSRSYFTTKSHEKLYINEN